MIDDDGTGALSDCRRETGASVKSLSRGRPLLLKAPSECWRSSEGGYTPVDLIVTVSFPAAGCRQRGGSITQPCLRELCTHIVFQPE